jgi:hypothetical protein
VVGTSMRVSNARAKAELGWHPMFPTYLDGIQAMVYPAPAGAVDASRNPSGR